MSITPVAPPPTAIGRSAGSSSIGESTMKCASPSPNPAPFTLSRAIRMSSFSSVMQGSPKPSGRLSSITSSSGLSDASDEETELTTTDVSALSPASGLTSRADWLRLSR
jgi:hypothetical protein